jgi:hypothetical protein
VSQNIRHGLEQIYHSRPLRLDLALTFPVAAENVLAVEGAPNFLLREPKKSGRTGSDYSTVLGPAVSDLLGSVLSDGATFTSNKEALEAVEYAHLRFCASRSAGARSVIGNAWYCAQVRSTKITHRHSV